MAFKKTILPLAMLGALSLGSLACGPADYGYTGIDVGFGPPEARAEVSIESPGPGYYWVPGYYDWQDGNYIWVAGSWQRPEHDGDVWVAPRYERNGSRYRYYRGHWSGSRSGRRDNDRRDRDHDRDHDHG